MSDNICLTLSFGICKNVNVKEWKLFGKAKKFKKVAKKFKKGVDIYRGLWYYKKVVSAEDTQARR